MLQRIQHEHTPYLAESALGGLRKPQHPSNTGDCDRGQEHGANIISMSLYGGHNIYDVGALRNAKLAKEYMPGWRVRVYANASELRQEVIVELGELHCRIPLFSFPWMGFTQARMVAWGLLPPVASNFPSKLVHTTMNTYGILDMMTTFRKA